MPTALKRLIIRPLSSTDIGALAALSERLGVEIRAEWDTRVTDPGYVILGAERDGTLVGYAGGQVRRSFGRATSTAWVDSFGVELGQRGLGVGRALAVELLGRLRARGARHALTLTPLHDRELGPFFRDLGFRDEPTVCLGRDL